MNLCGEAVIHKTFGVGRIIGFADNYMTVLFDGSKDERIFVYPSAFGAFLEIENEAFLDQIKTDKDLIAQELSKNQRINEELMKLAIPATPKKASPKSRKAAQPKTPV